ncbi:MAG: hypothetical protein LBK96_02830 [Prevotellaceae bacterium]|jgi:hypothetical protein|nr:hypothetical protein [Prevotellaceae bacterium]
MKIYKKLALIVISLFMLSSCSDMMDLHQEYIKDGETVYMPKPYQVQFLAGKERIYFECLLRNATNVTSVDISWNRGDSSQIIPVTPGAGYYWVSAWIPNMGEQSYTFEVQTSDAYGQHSLKTSGFANSYGELFQESLVNRPYRSFALTDRNREVSVELSWIAAAERLVWSEIRYDGDDGDMQTIRVLPSETATVCEKAMVNSVFEYRSAFLPEPEAVDTFYTDWQRIIPDPNYTLSMDGWTATASSYDGSAGAQIYKWGTPDVIFLNGFEYVWHTRYTGSTAQLPHWIEIDMQNLKSLTRLEVTRHTDTKTLHVIASETQISDKNALGNMTPAATLEYPGPAATTNITRSCDFETPLSARYIYFYMPDTHRNPYVSIQFMKVFGWTQ